MLDDLLARLDIGAFETHYQRDAEADFLDRGDNASAMMSHFMMPPKMLIRMPFTLGSAVMILNAAVTFSLLARRRHRGSSPASCRTA